MDLNEKMAELDARIAARKDAVNGDRKNPFAADPGEQRNPRPPRLIENNYDLLKYFSLIFFPALTALYVKLSEIWAWPLRVEIAATMAAGNAFLGTVVGCASWEHRKDLYRKQSKKKEG